MAGKERRDPTRTCVGCRQAGGRRSLLRVTRTPEGAVVFDAGGRVAGRGAYLHADVECLELARRRRALERALKAQVPDHLWASLSEAVAP